MISIWKICKKTVQLFSTARFFHIYFFCFLCISDCTEAIFFIKGFCIFCMQHSIQVPILFHDPIHQNGSESLTAVLFFYNEIHQIKRRDTVCQNPCKSNLLSLILPSPVPAFRNRPYGQEFSILFRIISSVLSSAHSVLRKRSVTSDRCIFSISFLI